MFLIDRMFIGGIKFVLNKIAAAVDAEMNDDKALRDELLAAQMRVELGEMSEEEFVDFERDILARLREIRESRGGAEGISALGSSKVTGVEANVYEGDEQEES